MTRVRIPLIKADLPAIDALIAPFDEILSNGRVTNFGPYVQQFETEIGGYLGTQAVCLSSATAGLILTLQGLDIPRGSRVAIPSFSFVATAQAVLYAGCTPVFVDVGRDGNMDPADLKRVLAATPDVRAVVAVHMYGLPCHTRDIEAAAAEHAARHRVPVPVVYDAAHAFGSAGGDVRVGNFGTAEVFSTSVTKVLTSVEGGIVSTRDARLLDRLRKMRNYGIASNYDAHFPGLNGKMSEFHALVGLANLRRFDDLIAARMERAERYRGYLDEHSSSRVLMAPAGVVSTYKDFTIELPDDLRPQRSAIVSQLADDGIETRAYFFPPIHEQQYFLRFADRPLPVTEDLSRRVITLPFSSTISDDDMRAVAEALGRAEHAGRQASLTGVVRS